MKNTLIILNLIFILGCTSPTKETESWRVDHQKEWEAIAGGHSGVELVGGYLESNNNRAYFSSKLKKFSQKQTFQSITLTQSPQWDSWQAIPKATPEMAANAPVFIPVSDGNYWFLARYKDDDTTGYHSWHSTDMKKWIHYGPVSSLDNKWVTTAEYVDGKFYIYYDKPNDEDPHLIIDEDLTDGLQGKDKGMVLRDPTHGSDAGIIRDEDGIFHLIYEDWSPINPRENSWDSPLAGHADSSDGINGFLPNEHPHPIDRRGKATGKIEHYKPASNQLVHGPDPEPYTYQVHEGEQDAFGDYTIIKVGGLYYLFCDYDSYDDEKSMRIGRWRTDDITKEFIWDGEIGEGFHPDPTVGFAEGKFYLLVQRNKEDFISDGPWVDGVEVRVGVDTDNDENIDNWTAFTKIKESYSQKKGFLKIIETTPASLDLSELASGYALKVEFRFQNKNGFYPVLDAFEVKF